MSSSTRPSRFERPLRFAPAALSTALALSVVAIVAGCDGGDDPPAADAATPDGATAADGATSAPAEGGATPDAAAEAGPGELASYPKAQYCADIQARATRCNREPVGEDDCSADYACLLKFRPEAREPLARCIATRDCDRIDDGCYADAAAPFANELGTYVNDCLAKRQACNDNFADDFCGPEPPRR